MAGSLPLFSSSLNRTNNAELPSSGRPRILFNYGGEGVNLKNGEIKNNILDKWFCF